MPQQLVDERKRDSCHNCGKRGHIEKNYRVRSMSESAGYVSKKYPLNIRDKNDYDRILKAESCPVCAKRHHYKRRDISTIWCVSYVNDNCCSILIWNTEIHSRVKCYQFSITIYCMVAPHVQRRCTLPGPWLYNHILSSLGQTLSQHHAYIKIMPGGVSIVPWLCNG